MRFFLFTIAVFLTSAATASDAVIFLVDSSGSMRESMDDGKDRAQVAKESIITVSQDISEGTYVGVLSFHGWVYEPALLDRAKFSNAVNSMSFGGSTPLGKYTKVAADGLLSLRSRSDRGGEFFFNYCYRWSRARYTSIAKVYP